MHPADARLGGDQPQCIDARLTKTALDVRKQFLILSNQVDNVQVGTTFFFDVPTWVNTARQAYCDTAGLNGVHYFLPAISASTHVISASDSLFTALAVDGEIMGDWLTGTLVPPSAP